MAAAVFCLLLAFLSWASSCLAPEANGNEFSYSCLECNFVYIRKMVGLGEEKWESGRSEFWRARICATMMERVVSILEMVAAPAAASHLPCSWRSSLLIVNVMVFKVKVRRRANAEILCSYFDVYHTVKSVSMES